MAATAEAVVRESDVVVCTTPAHEPYLRAGWLHPGLHITSMGSDMPGKQELVAELFRAGRPRGLRPRAQCVLIGELHHAVDAGLIDLSRVDELGEITARASNPGARATTRSPSAT